PTGVTSKSTVSPALRGLVPPTIWVPALSMRPVCLRPSEPVMPCTITFELLSRKIAMLCSLRRNLGGLGCRAVHRVHDRHQWVCRLFEDPAALFNVVAVEAD